MMCDLVRRLQYLLHARTLRGQRAGPVGIRSVNRRFRHTKKNPTHVHPMGIPCEIIYCEFDRRRREVARSIRHGQQCVGHNECSYWTHEGNEGTRRDAGGMSFGCRERLVNWLR